MRNGYCSSCSTHLIFLLHHVFRKEIKNLCNVKLEQRLFKHGLIHFFLSRNAIGKVDIDMIFVNIKLYHRIEQKV